MRRSADFRVRKDTAPLKHVFRSPVGRADVYFRVRKDTAPLKQTIGAVLVGDYRDFRVRKDTAPLKRYQRNFDGSESITSVSARTRPH